MVSTQETNVCKFLCFQLTDLEHLIGEIKSKLPKLKYLSLLGNAACPNQLSAHDKDDEDYLRYR
jgi:hypothetical protein